MRPPDQAVAKTRLAQQPLLDPAHAAVVARVIVAEQVQQAVQRENLQFGELRVPCVARLTAGDAAGDDDVAQEQAGGSLLGAS